MANLEEILMRSKQVMDKTKNMPRSGKVMTDGEMSYPQVNEASEPRFSESVARKSKLPREIVEAIRGAETSAPSSIMDSLDTTRLERVAKAERTMIKEQATPTNSSNVDYSLIRMIIEETMKKYMGQLKKNLLSESNHGSGLQLMTKQGNTFRFVTEDGKIFEGKMTYKGNINDR